jgi:2-oxo-4-hydroxy-4-carboxy-5-ureidoimidazoline decarboxylase
MAEPHRVLNTLSDVDARAQLLRCCGSTHWVEYMLRHRPFASQDVLFQQAAQSFGALSEADYLEAFSHHPRIGEDLAALRTRFAETASWSSQEQGAVAAADEQTLLQLRDLNRAYFERHGFVFLICATGKSAEEMLSALRERLPQTRAQELHIAADEQAKITRLRLEKLAP